MVTAENDDEALVLQFFEALGTGNLERARGLLRADATWTVMPAGVPGSGPHRGRREIIDEFLMPLRDSLFEPGTVSGGVDTLISKGGLVAAESQASARLKNGKSYHNRYVFVFEIRDGAIAAVREYMDSHYIVERLKP
jgi:hypothetical protein